MARSRHAQGASLTSAFDPLRTSAFDPKWTVSRASAISISVISGDAHRDAHNGAPEGSGSRNSRW